ncbi:hypothetical protein LTR09_009376 [Extremus antarcticus]|uniref:Uncharacterized protein n=1 Tax=Extremus antarcticus TaxID=702011 RepID=A0AAJ0G6A8_9PEZI|nr:hypothetical protein LTR09_009376 [Extremus antarcticus]
MPTLAVVRTPTLTRPLGQPWLQKRNALLAFTTWPDAQFPRPWVTSFRQLSGTTFQVGHDRNDANPGSPPLSSDSDLAKSWTIVDRLLPRERFGSSIFNTPLLLLLRLFYQATPFRCSTKSSLQSSTQSNTLQVLTGNAANQLSTPSITLSEASDVALSVNTRSWRENLLDSHYPIVHTCTLRSLTWIKSLSAPLSHEYIQFVLEDVDANQAHRLIVERDTYGDFVSIRSKLGAGITKRGVGQKTCVVGVSKPDEQHDLPLPLLSLSWTHLSARDRPSALELADIVAEVTQRHPKYNLGRAHCWWFCEAVFENMAAYRQSSGAPVLKHWPWAAYRYSYMVVGKNVLKRAALVHQAVRFSAEMDRDEQMIW